MLLSKVQHYEARDPNLVSQIVSSEEVNEMSMLSQPAGKKLSTIEKVVSVLY